MGEASLVVFAVIFSLLTFVLMRAARFTDINWTTEKKKLQYQWTSEERSILANIEGAVPRFCFRVDGGEAFFVFYSNGNRVYLSKNTENKSVHHIVVYDKSDKILGGGDHSIISKRLVKILENHRLCARSISAIFHSYGRSAFGLDPYELESGKTLNDYFIVAVGYNKVLIDKSQIHSFADIDVLNVFEQLTPVEIVALKTKGTV